MCACVCARAHGYCLRRPTVRRPVQFPVSPSLVFRQFPRHPPAINVPSSTAGSTAPAVTATATAAASASTSASAATAAAATSAMKPPGRYLTHLPPGRPLKFKPQLDGSAVRPPARRPGTLLHLSCSFSAEAARRNRWTSGAVPVDDDGPTCVDKSRRALPGVRGRRDPTVMRPYG